MSRNANVFTGLAALNLSDAGHTSTALRLGLMADSPAGMKGRFNLYLGSYGEDARPATLFYTFGRNCYSSPFFDRSKPDVVMTFIHYCGAEARMADTHYNRKPSVQITRDLEEEAQAILADHRAPPILSTFKNFVPHERMDNPRDFLCHETDEQSLDACGLMHYGSALKRAANPQGYIYPTHFFALRSSVYTKAKDSMIITPETEEASKEDFQKQPVGGWSIFMLQQDGTAGGTHHFLSYSNQLLTTVNTLSALENAYILPRMSHRTFALNSEEMAAHYERYAESAIKNAALTGFDSYRNN